VLQVAFSQQEPPTSQKLRLASCGNDHSIKVWKVASHGTNHSRIDVQELCHLKDAHVSTISALTWGRGQASGHLLFSGGWDHSIKVWDLSGTTSQSNAPTTSIAILESHQGIHTIIYYSEQM
jgi:WD40 repeat protein